MRWYMRVIIQFNMVILDVCRIFCYDGLFKEVDFCFFKQERKIGFMVVEFGQGNMDRNSK